MNKSTPQNMDGFVVRRRQAPSQRQIGLNDLSVPKEYLINPELKTSSAHTQPKELQKDDMPEQTRRHANAASLSGFDLTLQEEPAKKQSRFRLKKPSKRAVKWTMIILLIIGLIAGGFFAWKVLLSGGKIFRGNPLALLTGNKALAKDSNGRTNVLLFGTSDDDPDHPGGELTDSIMVASLSQDKKDAYLVSVPRDLYVKYGKACNSGYEGKINEVYMCNADESEEAGQNALKDKVGEVFGLDIQYAAHVNYTVLKEAVDSVGGITVQIESSDPRGILDRNFDWKCGYRCNYVKYPNGPANLDGEHALALARARNAAGGYGLSEGNFDREQYQQKILIALKDKATSAGTLTNPVAVTGLIDSLGNNVKTNIATEEVNSFIALARDMDTSKINRLQLNGDQDPLVTTGNLGGASIVRPSAGLYDYSDIQSYIKANLSGDKSALEGAMIDVLNGSGVAGMAQTKADEIKALGLDVETIANAPAGSYPALSLYDLSDGKKPSTLEKLQTTLGVTAAPAASLPDGVTTDSDFVIIVGSNGAN